MVFNLRSEKCDNNDNSFPQLSHPQHSLLMIIFDTPETDLYNVVDKSDKRKVGTPLVKSFSTCSSCSVRAMYNIFIVHNSNVS